MWIAYLPRFAGVVAVLVLVPQAAPLAALAMFMLGFAITHDAAHGALRWSRRATSIALAVGGAVIGTSGHALRLMHMRHHARPLAADDFEGAAARLSFWRALVAAPRLAVALHLAAWRTGRARRWQAIEYGALVALAIAACIGPRWLAIHVAVAFAMQLFAPWWAGHIPHRAAWLIALARRFAVTRSPTLASLAYHDVHHLHPKVPTWRLREVARRGPDGVRQAPPSGSEQLPAA